MASSRERLEDAPLGQLADMMEAGPNHGYHIASAELQRRLAAAQLNAANAAERTAQYTKDTARWMFWSVMAIAATSGVQALFAFLTWYAPTRH